MNFRDKLARLSAPVSRAAVSAARDDEPRIERDSEMREWSCDEPERAETHAVGNLSLVRADTNRSVKHSAVPGIEGDPCAGEREAESESERLARISHLRTLIGDVLARGATWRAPRAGGAEIADIPRKVESRDGFAGTRAAPARETLLAAIASAERVSTRAFAEGDAFAEGGAFAAGDAFASGDASAERDAWARAEAFAAVDAHRDSTSHSLRTRAHPAAAPGSFGGRLGAEGETDDGAAHSSAARISMLREAIDGWAPARGRLARVFARQPWATRETPFGPLHVVERWLEPSHVHGQVAVHSALERLPATVAALALDPELANLDLSRMLFLDTETTGLMGGSGTVAFLVGIACFHDDSLLLTQLLLPNLGGEVPMLLALAEHLAAASCILTYNGKSFDWPLLRTRYVMNRLPVPALPPHVDLLHASRRIWKPRLGSVRLTDVEREIMRFSREGDVDGAEIPSRYFSFLRDGGTEWLVPVLEHNQNDLIALPAMLGVLGERFEQIECGDHALDALAYGRLALRVADPERAAAFAIAAVTASEGSPLESQAWSFRGEVARRAREAEVAIRHYEQALELCEDELRSAALHVMLAKLYEHAVRDLKNAYRHARDTEPAEGPELQGRRLGRLTRKLEREGERAQARTRRKRCVHKRGARVEPTETADKAPACASPNARRPERHATLVSDARASVGSSPSARAASGRAERR